MFARIKKSGSYRYVQVVHNERIEGKVRQRVIATLGRLDVLKDDQGRPVCCELLPGNTADIKTLIPVIDRLRERFGIREVCVVADRGMISKQTMAQLSQRNIRYILGARLRNVKEIREELILRIFR